MKYRILLMISLISVLSSYSQSFVAETGDIYIGEPEGNYYGLISVKSGVLKLNDKIDIYTASGFKYTAVVTAIKDLDSKQQVKEIKTGKDGYVDFTTKDKAPKYEDALRKGYKIFPAGYNASTGATKADAKAAIEKTVSLKVTLDGQPFRGKVSVHGASFWKKGVKGVLEKPYMQLQFMSVDAPDSRALTIQIMQPKETAAVYNSKDLEVNFSGAADGNVKNTTLFGFANGKGDTDFKIEITKYEKLGPNKARISGKISGSLKNVTLNGFGSKKTVFENGVFENIEVEVFENLYRLNATEKQN